jgi:fumarylacetoacetate (FAA) hydrolase
MKLASLNNNTRDGQLVVVSRDLKKYVSVEDIARTLQEALDSWNHKKVLLEQVYTKLNNQELSTEKDFKQEDCLSPLPRAYAWLDGSAYINHVELTRKARNAQIPESFYTNPLMYQGGSDTFIAPHGDILVQKEEYGIDFEAEVAIITDDVPMGTSKEDANKHIKLLMLINDVSLRNLIPEELAKGIGFVNSKTSNAFSPVCITPDELEDSWIDSKVDLAINIFYNEEVFGKPICSQDMTFSFADLLQHAAKTRELGAGTIIGSGTVSNKLDGKEGKTIKDGGLGYSCIAEQRVVEIIKEGSAKTSFMNFEDRVEIFMNDKNGNSIFGSIKQKVKQFKKD